MLVRGMKELRFSWKPIRYGICLLVLLGGALLFYQQVEAQHLGTILAQVRSQRLAHLNTEDLDLAFIINEVDRIGGDDTQFNWKELVAILGVQSENQVQAITSECLEEIAKLFKTDETLKSFEDVVDQLDWNETEQARGFQYLEDLAYVGYVPEKLQPTAAETQFIEQLIEPAMQNYAQSGILPSITIAQAILESNWGTSELAQEANNLFGIKVGVGWTGEELTYRTLEYHDVWIDDAFRKYDTWQASIDDHADFLLQNPRYQIAGVFEAKTYRTQAQALQDAGYSTAQDEEGNFVYAKRLGELIRQYNLQLIDHEVLYFSNI